MTRYVNARGGRLYLWGEPLRGDLAWAHAGTEPPADLDFVRSTAISEFELFIEEGMKPWPSVRLARRWWGLRDGVVVDTGNYWGPTT